MNRAKSTRDFETAITHRQLVVSIATIVLRYQQQQQQQQRQQYNNNNTTPITPTTYSDKLSCNRPVTNLIFIESILNIQDAVAINYVPRRCYYDVQRRSSPQ